MLSCPYFVDVEAKKKVRNFLVNCLVGRLCLIFLLCCRIKNKNRISLFTSRSESELKSCVTKPTVCV